MKHFKQRAAALGLALVLGLAPPAAASEAMGSEIQGGSAELSVGTILNKQYFWSDTYSDLRSERYFTYTPNTKVTPTVVYGDKVLTRATLTDMARGLEAQGKRVIGGINGDLYVLSTGAPLGMVVTDGVARSIPGTDNAGYYAVGFRRDGTAFIGRPELTVTATFKGFTFSVGGGVNKIRNAGTNYVLYTEDFSATTQNSEPGIDVILTPVLEGLGETVTVDLDIKQDTREAADPEAPVEVKGTLVKTEKPTVGGRVTYKVEQVLESTGAIPIPEGKAVLSINSKSDAYYIDYIKLLQPGDTVDIDISTTEQPWTEADQAMGGLTRLVTAGGVDTYSISASDQKDRTAYSAVGVKADGTAVFYTLDGKQPGYSIGASLTQVAQRLVELGCVDAISLDGGGSTTLGATYPDGSGMGVLNKPSDGKERANSVAVFLTTEMKASGELAGLYVTPGDGFLLSGAQVQLSAKGLDSNYYTMDLSETPTWSIQNGDGGVTSDGLFTAGGAGGITQVTATARSFTGSSVLTVVNTPDKIALSDADGKAVTLLALDPNGTIDLKASASYKNLPLTVRDACFTWTLDPAVGTVDAEGVVTAGPKSASGNLTVSAGGYGITIPVSVAGHVYTLEDFETESGTLTASGGLTLTRETASDRVRYGNASLRVEYDAAGGAASLVSTLAPAVGEKYLNLWVYGDGSPNSLTATFADAAGVTGEVMLTGLDFTGWKYVSVAIPEASAALRSINLLYGGGEEYKGSFWLDQLTTSNEPVQDTTPPVVTVSLEGTALTAVAADFVDKKFTAGQFQVTYDGKKVDHTFDAAANTVKATLPAPDGKLHRVAVLVTDASGNIGRGAVNVDAAAGTPSAFTDTAEHWSAAYAEYLYQKGVTTGVPGGAEGELLFQPEKNITRGELFAMVGRWLGVDLAQYESVELPFADKDSVPDWALPGVKAMYALGYLKGSTAGDGLLYANAGGSISRAEAMTILGRVQAGGYAEAELTFTDAAQVPDWAAAYVKTLVGQGVVGGYENQILPNALLKRGEVAKMLFSMT